MAMKRRVFLQWTGAAALGGAATACSTPDPASGQDPFAGLKSMTEDIVPLGKADFSARHDKARILMEKNGVDVLFLGGSNTLYYFSGTRMGGRDRLFAMLLPRKGAPVYICPDFEIPTARERIVYGEEDIRTWQEHEDPFKLTADVLKELDLGKGSVGVDEYLPFWHFYRLKQALPTARYRDADIITHPLRAIKSPKEIAFIRRAVEVTIAAYKASLKTLHAGMTKGEFQVNFSRAAAKLGAPGGGGASFGPASSFVHGTVQDPPLEEGTVVLMDCGCRVQNYTSDVSRTVVFGIPSDKAVRAWEAARKAQLAGIAAIRPGVPCQEVDRVIRRVLEESGYGPGYKNLGHRVGHGMGLDGHEGPWLVEGDTTPMQPGMVFAFDGAVYFPGEFGIRLEDDVVVTEDGCEVFGDCLSVSIDQPFSC